MYTANQSNPMQPTPMYIANQSNPMEPTPPSSSLRTTTLIQPIDLTPVSFPTTLQVLVEQALMVSQELIRVAILWHEMWHEALEEASRLWFGQQNVEGVSPYLPTSGCMRTRTDLIKASCDDSNDRTTRGRHAGGAESLARGDVGGARHAAGGVLSAQFRARPRGGVNVTPR